MPRTPVSNKAKAILRILDRLYPQPPIPLEHLDNFTLLIAVLLSAQCTDIRVNKVTKVLYKKASSPAEMLKLGVKKIENIIRPCGLAPTKAKNIIATSKILLEKYNGHVPEKMEELEKLPGVGHKTASVMMIQAFNQPAFPVDTHIHRLAARWKISSGRNVAQSEKDLKAFFPKRRWAKLHLQMIYFGREYCPARGHDPEECPICSICQA